MNKIIQIFLAKETFILVLLVVLANEVSTIVWQVLTKPQSFSFVETEEVEYKPVRFSSLPSIRTWQGKEIIVPKEVVVEEESPKLNIDALNLTYKGMFISSGISLALIGRGRSNVGSYLIGDNVSSVKVKDITIEYVLLEKHGKSAKLFFKRDGRVDALVEKINGKKAVEIKSAPALAKQLKKFEAIEVDEKILRDPATIKLKNDLLRQPLKIVDYINFTPIFTTDGGWESVKIYPKNRPEIFKILGFIPGDSIVAIDDISMKTLSKNPTQWQRLISSGKFSLEIEREGIRQTLILDLSK